MIIPEYIFLPAQIFPANSLQYKYIHLNISNKHLTYTWKFFLSLKWFLVITWSIKPSKH